MDFDDLYECDPGFTDCYYMLDFAVGQEPGAHRYTLYVADYSGLTASCSFLGIDREIREVTATAGQQAVDISWYASSFDPGVMFFVERSIDAGVSYNHQLQDEGGNPLFRIFAGDSTYSMPDSSVEYNFPYFYRVVDTESGPGPDHYWEMETLMDGEIGGLPDPPGPTVAPQISFNFKSMAAVSDSGFASIWFDEGTDWAGWYIIGFDEDGVPYGQEKVHFGHRECVLGGLSTGTTYHVAAKGRSAAGSTAFSNEVVFTVLPAPNLLSAEVVDATSIIAVWSGVTGADGYDLICTRMHPTPVDTTVDAGADTTWRVDGLDELEQYCVRVKCRDAFGNRSQSSNHEYVVTEGYGAMEEILAQGGPLRDTLFQNYPNPFNPRTRIPHQMSHEGPVRIGIYDVKGRLVRPVVDRPHRAGAYLARWDGMDHSGRPAPAGVYFARFATNSVTDTKKMVLAR